MECRIKGRIGRQTKPPVKDQEKGQEVGPDIDGLIVNLKDTGEIVQKPMPRWAISGLPGSR